MGGSSRSLPGWFRLSTTSVRMLPRCCLGEGVLLVVEGVAFMVFHIYSYLVSGFETVVFDFGYCC